MGSGCPSASLSAWPGEPRSFSLAGSTGRAHASIMKPIPRLFAHAALATMLLSATPFASAAQRRFFDQRADSVQNRILKRWVGAKVNGLPLWLDFFGDTMLVVSDNVLQYPVDYALTPRNLTVYGDTGLSHMLYHAFHRRHTETEAFFPESQFVLRYRFSLDKLLVEADKITITMTEQNPLARPIEASWIADLPDGTQMELFLSRSGTASHRIRPGGSRVFGLWERAARNIEFDWTPASLEVSDSTLIWTGFFDAPGQKILLDSIGPGTSVTIFRRIIR